VLDRPQRRTAVLEFRSLCVGLGCLGIHAHVSSSLSFWTASADWRDHLPRLPG
jgi:hypothetical protein